MDSTHAVKNVLKKRGFMDSDLQDFLQFSDKNETKIKISELKRFLHSLLVSYEKQINTSTTLFTNISLMSSRINLSYTQQQILSLIVLKERYEPLKDCFERLHTASESHLYSGLAKVIGSAPPDCFKSDVR